MLIMDGPKEKSHLKTADYSPKYSRLEIAYSNLIPINLDWARTAKTIALIILDFFFFPSNTEIISHN